MKLKNQPNFKRSSALYGKEKTPLYDRVDGVVVRFQKCCNPIPGDKILGSPAVGDSRSIHLTVQTSSPMTTRGKFLSHGTQQTICVSGTDKGLGDDKKGLLSEISTVMSTHKANILSAQAMTYPDRSAAGIYEIEIGHMSQLQKIIKSLQKIKGIRSV